MFDFYLLGPEVRHAKLFVGRDLMSISCTLRMCGVLEHLDVRCSIDAANAAEFRALLLETIEDRTHHLVVDITGADFVDASGLGVLVGALRYARIENKLVNLVCNGERLLKILALTSLDRDFCIYESVQNAVWASTELRTSPVITRTNNAKVA